MRNLKILLTFVLLTVLVLPVFSQICTLSDKEQIDIIYLLEEEKMAHDLYVSFDEKWDMPFLSGIAYSESQHIAIVESIILNYSVPSPDLLILNKERIIQSNYLQKSMGELLANGSKSPVYALKSAAQMEEMSIIDLGKIIANSSNSELIDTYRLLIQLSGQHLREITDQLNLMGYEYRPVIISPETYNLIM